MRRGLCLGLLAILVAGCVVRPDLPVAAGCPSNAAVETLAGRVLSGKPAPPLDVADRTAALCAQAKLVTLLQRHWGVPVGYKAGLTNAAAQARFGVTEPVRGVLLAEMMLPDGASIPAGFGALPRFEADLVLVVADAAINEATSPAEVLRHLSAVRPFIELPDLVVADPSSLTGPVITAINVGARYGVLGAPVPVDPSPTFLESLAAMQVVVTDQTGAQLASAPGAAVLGHPLNAVLWLIRDGVTLQPGDLISTGSIGPLLPPRPGLTATVTYRGLPSDPTVRVTFE